MKTSKKNIALYLASQVVSLFGSSIAQCVVFWYITLETQSGTMMTIAMIAGFLPTFFISPFAGVWADRYDRKKIIMLADAFVAVSTLALVVAFRLGYGNVWIIIAAMAMRGLGQGIQQPAVGAFLPQLVNPDQLMKVNSINSSAQSAMMLISPALGGLLISVFPIEVALAVDVITAILAILILRFFVKSKHQQKKEPSADNVGYFSDLKLGLKYVVKHSFVGRLFIYSAVLTLVMAPAGFLFSLVITQRFGADAWRLAVNDTIFAVGMILGSVLMMTWGGFKNKLKTIVLGCFALGIATIAYGLVNNFTLFLAFSVFVGVAMPLFNTPAIVIIQENVENEYLGRVMSISTMLSTLGMPISMMIFGPLADVIGLKAEFLITGAIMMSVTAVLALDKKMHRAINGQNAIPERSENL